MSQGWQKNFSFDSAGIRYLCRMLKIFIFLGGEGHTPRLGPCNIMLSKIIMLSNLVRIMLE